MTQDAPSSYATLLAEGNALVAQAQRAATQDFAQARALWQQAGKQFYLAHKADPDQAEGAFRLAQAWMAERGLQGDDIEQSRCQFCHSEPAHPEVAAAIGSKGYFIIPLQGC